MRHLLDIDDLTADELGMIVALAESYDHDRCYEHKGVALVFEKASLRTRSSTEMAAVQLGAHPVYITDAEVGIDTRESAEDIVRTLAGYHAVLCARVRSHAVLERMAVVEVIPIVNLLSDRAHPLQAIADVLTMRSEFGTLGGRVVTYVGDFNNVACSLSLAVGLQGGEIRAVSPPGYGLSDESGFIDRCAAAGVKIEQFDHVEDAVANADVIYTDTWVSMGEESERDDRLRAFQGFQVDSSLLDQAKPDAIFMHCLPAHRGEEVSAEVIDGPRSRVWPQAANRLHSARAVLSWLQLHNSTSFVPSASLED